MTVRSILNGSKRPEPKMQQIFQFNAAAILHLSLLLYELQKTPPILLSPQFDSLRKSPCKSDLASTAGPNSEVV